MSLFFLQLQAFFLVADDIMDASVTRRGQPCWYKKVRLVCNDLYFSINDLLSFSCQSCSLMLKDGIGLDAINDSFLLEAAIYRLLRRHCRDQPYYVHLLELFTEVLKALIDYTGTSIQAQDSDYISVCFRHLSRQSLAKLWTSWQPLLVRLISTGSQWKGNEVKIVRYI